MYTTFITVIINHVSINSDTTFSLLPLLAHILNSNNTLLEKLYSVLREIKASIMIQFILDHIRGHGDRTIWVCCWSADWNLKISPLLLWTQTPLWSVHLFWLANTVRVTYHDIFISSYSWRNHCVYFVSRLDLQFDSYGQQYHLLLNMTILTACVSGFFLLRGGL